MRVYLHYCGGEVTVTDESQLSRTGGGTVEVGVAGPGAGDAIQLGPVRIRILEDGTTTGHRLGVGEITLPPHTDGPPQHRHARHDEGFYVVSGRACFTVGDTPYHPPA